MAKGFFDGSGTADGFDGADKCLLDLETDIHLKGAIRGFKQKGLQNILTGNVMIASKLKVYKNAESDCQNLEAEWDKIGQMAEAWEHPLTFGYHAGKDIIING